MRDVAAAVVDDAFALAEGMLLIRHSLTTALLALILLVLLRRALRREPLVIVAMAAFKEAFGTIVRAVLPFIVIMLGVLVVVCAMPGLSLFLLKR